MNAVFIPKGETIGNIIPSSRLSIIGETKEMIEHMQEIKESIEIFFETTSKILFYIKNPKIILSICWNWTVEYSFWICMFVCLLSIIAYMIGWEKGRTWASRSVVGYIIILMFDVGIKSVF